MLSVAHNLTAYNAVRQYNLINNSRAKSVEKLSSGYKVNRAADDAASLAISEKMRRQVRGLTQASLNCQDGISLNQVKDGALNEVHDILNRMNELSVKAANAQSDSRQDVIVQPSGKAQLCGGLELEGRAGTMVYPLVTVEEHSVQTCNDLQFILETS